MQISSPCGSDFAASVAAKKEKRERDGKRVRERAIVGGWESRARLPLFAFGLSYAASVFRSRGKFSARQRRRQRSRRFSTSAHARCHMPLCISLALTYKPLQPPKSSAAAAFHFPSVRSGKAVEFVVRGMIWHSARGN